ncbi:MAG: hypothetical protein WC009_07805 [Methylotenera sp.]
MTKKESIGISQLSLERKLQNSWKILENLAGFIGIYRDTTGYQKGC